MISFKTNIYYQAIKKQLRLSLFSFGFMALFILLSQWQWQRANEKSEIANALQTTNTTISELAWLHSANKNQSKSLIDITAQLAHSPYILLDNQFLNNSLGYKVFTVLLSQQNKYYLLHLGWLQAPKKRDLIPNINSFKLEQKPSSYRLQLSTQQASFVLEDTAIEKLQDNVWRVQSIALRDLSLQLGYTLEKSIFNSALAQQQYPIQDQKKRYQQQSQRHIAYSWQWAAMALALLLLYLKKIQLTTKEASCA